MNQPKVVGMYRVKNGERWIEKSIESILDLCSEIVIFDDRSSDSTLEICRGFKQVVHIEGQKDKGLDEVRDRNKLLKIALKRNPDYLFSIDADEVLFPNSADIIKDEITILYPEFNVFQFQFLTMYDEPNKFRYDGKTSHTWHNRLFKVNNKSDLAFEPSGYPGNLHCGSIPPNVEGIERPVRSNAKILHYSIYDEESRIKKYQYYNKIDPNSEKQDFYRNIISIDSKFAGPNGLEFEWISKEFLV